VSRRLSWAGLNWVGLGLVLVVALAIGARGGSGPPTEDQRVRGITSVIRCPTCRGLSAEQSDAPSAESIRDEVRRRVEAGETDAAIKDYLVSRYGEDILLQPRSRLVWGLPIVAVVIAVGALVVVVRRRRVPSAARVSAADEELVERALRS
jgi:cytochrome c-type biogenesis protein CcmH